MWSCPLPNATRLPTIRLTKPTHPVCTATPQNWLEMAADRRLEAVFLGPELSRPDVDAVIDSVGNLDPNVPIVLLGEHATE